MSGRSLLIVAQLAPPMQITAAQRVAGLVKYLGRLGVDVTVLSSTVSGEGPIEGASSVVRAGDLLATGLNWRRGQMQAIGGGETEYAGASRLEGVVVPDVGMVSWLPFAARSLRSLVRAHDFDCLLTTSPPHSTHLAALALRSRRPPWIVELRDGWTFDPPRTAWPTRAQSLVDASLERRVMRAADALVGVTRPIADDLGERFGKPSLTLTNGFDGEQDVDPALADDLVTPGRVMLLHTGRMSVVGRNPAPILDALSLLGDERLELVLAGPVTAGERAALEQHALDGALRLLGSLPRARTLALQRRADVLVVLARGVSVRSVATGKLYEYLAAGRPILVLGDGTEAARIVDETRSGLSVDPDDAEAIADAVRRLTAGEAGAEPDPDAVARYSYSAVATRLAELVDELAR